MRFFILQKKGICGEHLMIGAKGKKVAPANRIGRSLFFFFCMFCRRKRSKTIDQESRRQSDQENVNADGGGQTDARQRS